VPVVIVAAIVGNDTADTVKAYALLVIAAVAGLLVIALLPFFIRRLRHLSIDVGKIKVDMSSVKTEIVEEIKPRVITTNDTTNHRSVGDPTMVEQIRTVDGKVDDLNIKLDEHIGHTYVWHQLVIAKLGITIEEQEINDKASVLRRH
jgi:hypothetical protein